MTTFLHTADWQIGKPFQSIKDEAKRQALRAQRIDSIRSLKTTVIEQGAEFVIVAGDLFDSFTPDKSTVAAFCSAVGELEVPVYAIPGNHDHGGPGCVWEQEFFLREQESLAPNFHLLRVAEPVVTPHAVLLPCPLLRRHETSNPLAWLSETHPDTPQGLPHIIIAHGSTQGFSSRDEEDSSTSINDLNLAQLPEDSFDYIALGDWHGMKQISPKAWYPGTPEQDRFAKGEDNKPGHCLIVKIPTRSAAPEISPILTNQINWHETEFTLHSDDSIEALKALLDEQLGQRSNRDLLKLHLNGALSLSGAKQLEDLLESLEARLIHLRIRKSIAVEPSEAELHSLTERDDPLIADLASELAAELEDASDDEQSSHARKMLRELHLQLQAIS